MKEREREDLLFTLNCKIPEKKTIRNLWYWEKNGKKE